ncbi:MAG TPA: M23 family metallopeptidase [Kiritimatiellia bacterium]|nr:M23 family metallopeptidase [Kiritimatiellia bacterium]
MFRYELPEHHDSAPGFWRKHAWWLIPLILLDAVAVAWWLRRDRGDDAVPAAEVAGAVSATVPEAPPPPPGLVYGFPTAQHSLLSTNLEGIYMPTGSGRLESALYGSVRTRPQGSSVLPAFHEGIDIAPLARDSRQMPTDRILAAADGRVAYANRIAGNSNYGRYIVLVHDDPLGEIYTLYAHMEEIDARIRPGLMVRRGEDMGRMGHSASTGIPIARAHLHFEAGVIMNQRFQTWFRHQKLKPDHGNFHGYNLTGIQPLDVFRRQELYGGFSMLDYLSELEPAFVVVARVPRKPDYYVRYPALWEEGDWSGVVTIAVAEGGAPLRGRPATLEERNELGNQRHRVVTVDEAVLGRNGLRLVTRRQGQWVLGRNGEQWLEILTYH